MDFTFHPKWISVMLYCKFVTESYPFNKQRKKKKLRN